MKATKADFFVNQRVSVTAGEQKGNAGAISVMHEESASVVLDNGVVREYEYQYLRPLEPAIKYAEADETPATPFVAAAIEPEFDGNEIEFPDASPPPFEGGGGVSAGGGAEASFDDESNATNASADFSNVESGSDSTADSSSSDSSSGGL